MVHLQVYSLWVTLYTKCDILEVFPRKFGVSDNRRRALVRAPARAPVHPGAVGRGRVWGGGSCATYLKIPCKLKNTYFIWPYYLNVSITTGR